MPADGCGKRRWWAIRLAILKPLIDEFFDWVRTEYDRVKTERGLVPSALGYASRQEQGLRNFLRDGRLRMDNYPSEGALKPVCTGRRAWLFFGSDDHAHAAANLVSLIASCQLHRIEPEQYIAELIHVMSYFLMAPMTDTERPDLVELLEDRYDKSSTILTTQLPTRNRHEAIGVPTIADAICDRVVHNSHILSLRGPSIRRQRGLKTKLTNQPAD